MYKCSVCQEKKKSIRAYIIHFRIHRNNASFQCNIENCTKNFKLYSTFVSHLNRFHKFQKRSTLPVILKDKTIKCCVSLCQKQVKSLKDLTKHYRLKHLHRGEVVRCPFLNCTLTFKSKNTLSVHLSRYHKDEEE